jgi:hypothetical protein
VNRPSCTNRRKVTKLPFSAMIITRLHLLGSIFFAVVTNVSADSLAGPVPVRPSITYPDNKPPRPVDVWCGKAYRATDGVFRYHIQNIRIPGLVSQD